MHLLLLAGLPRFAGRLRGFPLHPLLYQCHVILFFPVDLLWGDGLGQFRRDLRALNVGRSQLEGVAAALHHVLLLLFIYEVGYVRWHLAVSFVRVEVYLLGAQSSFIFLCLGVLFLLLPRGV